jgi:hypothetical protein
VCSNLATWCPSWGKSPWLATTTTPCSSLPCHCQPLALLLPLHHEPISCMQLLFCQGSCSLPSISSPAPCPYCIPCSSFDKSSLMDWHCSPCRWLLRTSRKQAMHWVAKVLEGSHTQSWNSPFTVHSTEPAHQSVSTLTVTLRHDKNRHYFQVPKLIYLVNIVIESSLVHRLLHWLQYLL